MVGDVFFESVAQLGKAYEISPDAVLNSFYAQKKKHDTIYFKEQEVKFVSYDEYENIMAKRKAIRREKIKKLEKEYFDRIISSKGRMSLISHPVTHCLGHLE